MGIRLLGTGHAVPEKILTNEDLGQMVETNDEWITTRTGIKTRHISETETTTSLAVAAARAALEEAEKKEGIQKEEIGAVIVATSTPDYAFPSTAALCARELGLSEEVMTFDLAAACTGFLYGLGVANGLLATGRKPYLLLIGSERLSKIVDYTDRSTCILFGDGAGAAVLAASDRPFIQKSWTRGEIEVLNCPGVGEERMLLSMNGNQVFKFAVTVLAQAIDSVLSEAKLSMEEVDWVICHQANERIIRHVARKYPGQEGKFYMNIAGYGNTSAASIPICLSELMKSGRLVPGMKVVICGFGAGLTWSGAIFEHT